MLPPRIYFLKGSIMPEVIAEKQERIFGRRVELNSGHYLDIQGWGLADVAKNFDTFLGIFQDFMSMGEQEMTASQREAFVSKQMQRITRLLESAVVDGDVSFDQVRGLDNLVTIIEAVIEENALFEALGKAARVATKGMASVNEVMGRVANGNPTSAEPTT